MRNGTTPLAEAHQRIDAIDAIRATALLLGIVLHSTLSFASGVDLRLWPIRDDQQSEIASVLMFLIHIFRMPVFFLLAGFFGRLLLIRYGETAFWLNRIRRIAAPLVFGWIGCFVAIVGIVAWALAKANGGVLPDRVPDELANAGISFLHLWFLYVLLWLYALIFVLRRVVSAAEPSGSLPASVAALLHLVLQWRVASLLIAIPIALALYSQPNWQWWMGIPTPGYTLIPPPVPLLIFGYCFVLGWLMHRNQLMLAELSRSWGWNAAIGAVGATACLSLVGTRMSAEVVTNGIEKFVFAAAYAITVVSWMFAFIGVFLRFMKTVPDELRYVAKASYWIYIAHLPMVMAVQTAVVHYSLPWIIKFLVVNILVFGIAVGTYALWNRLRSDERLA